MRMPAEWTAHDAVWTAWPHDAEQWTEGLEAPRRALMAMCAEIADGERVELLVRDARDEAEARSLLGSVPVRFHHGRYGDTWLRDTGPMFVDSDGELVAARFRFDGWGGKYVLAGDTEVAAQIVEWTGIAGTEFGFVLEGGAIEVDGAGMLLTTRSCLLDGIRNPHLDARGFEARLRDALGAEHVIWLERGLANDHTDGHVDTLARFVAPGVVAAMAPAQSDPNRDVLDAIIRDLGAAQLEVVTVPSPGAVLDARGALLPASYLNFYIANKVVVVPTYGVAADDSALAALEPLFPGRRIVGIPGKAVVVGGGAFHCCTQQQPALPSAR